MRHPLFALPTLAAFALGLCAALLPEHAASAAAAPRVTIVVGANAPALEQLAATELASQLQSLVGAQATTQTALPADDAAVILIGSPQTSAAVDAVFGKQWPKLSRQGHLVKSVPFQGRTVLVLGGGSPVASLWAVHEFGYRCGIRHLLHGDFLPLEKPAFTLAGFDVVLEPRVKRRAWSAFIGQPFGAESWSVADHTRLLTQLAKLKFTHIVLPAALTPVAALRVDGDTPGRKVFGGARQFENADRGDDFLPRIKAAAAAVGIFVQVGEMPDAIEINPGPANASVLPQFNLETLATQLNALRLKPTAGFVARVVIPGDLNASAHFLSRASFADQLTAAQSVSDLVTPICGKEVDERLLKGFGLAAQAAALITANDAAIAVPAARMTLRHLEAKAAPPAWLTEAKNLYAQAMNEMYRANTRARDGARPYILYHAKRFEFALHYLTSIELLWKAGFAGAEGKNEARTQALEQAVEAMYNALNALADVARDASDRGTIAILNVHAYRPLLQTLEAAAKP
ncbi:hypothetical protein LBMAG56_14370 [Verrucomicrobiota bacterium]|nr:hypothetical protein LBMAG56_14370 [Verrucomicrobiota bacterium]